MNIIIQPRASGKTYRLIRWLEANPDGRMVVPTHHRVGQLADTYPHLGSQILSFNVLRREALRRTKVVYDDFDVMFESFVFNHGGSPPLIATMRTPEPIYWAEDILGITTL